MVRIVSRLEWEGNYGSGKIRGMAAGQNRHTGPRRQCQDCMDKFIQFIQKPDKVGTIICLVFKVEQVRLIKVRYNSKEQILNRIWWFWFREVRRSWTKYQYPSELQFQLWLRSHMSVWQHKEQGPNSCPPTSFPFDNKIKGLGSCDITKIKSGNLFVLQVYYL